MGSDDWWQETVDGVELHVRVQPGAKRTQITGVVEGRLRIRLGARPVDGAANRELVRFLAHRLGVARSKVTVLRGERGRSKTVAVGAPVDPSSLTG